MSDFEFSDEFFQEHLAIYDAELTHDERSRENKGILALGGIALVGSAPFLYSPIFRPVGLVMLALGGGTVVGGAIRAHFNRITYEEATLEDEFPFDEN